MPKVHGKNFIIKISDRNGSYITIAGLTEKSFAIEGVGHNWKWIISGSGDYRNSPSDHLLRAVYKLAIKPLLLCKIEFDGLHTISYEFALTSLVYSGASDDYMKFSFVLERDQIRSK